jgi:hypothetical protein
MTIHTLKSLHGIVLVTTLLLVPIVWVQTDGGGYTFKGGYPTPETVQKAYDDADLNRAIQAYRVFYPTVSGAAIFKGNAKIGVIPNKSFGTLDTQPKHVGYTLNSDTPYAPLLLDLTDGPMVLTCRRDHSSASPWI